MTTDLHIAADFTLPSEAVTETFAILAKRRVGKSNAAVVMAEQMYDHAIPWVAIDPKGDWYGVRSNREGTGPGLAIPVFGGAHGDIPLEAGAGAYLAELVAERRLTCVLDVSEFSKADQIRFLVAFAEHLLKVNRDPLHLFLEECDEYIPQEKFADEAKLVRAFSRLVRHGGFKGIGSTLITQRPALVNKNVLSQTETLILLRTLAPLDQDAAKGWLKHHPAASEIIASLNSLAPGEAWVVSPAFLNLTKRITFDRRRTFDSGATPKIGQARVEPARLADVDLAAVKEAMAATIERAQAEDPKLLRRQIEQLRAQVVASKPSEPERIEVPVEVPAISEDVLMELASALTDYQKVGERITAAVARLMAGFERAVSTPAAPSPPTRRVEAPTAAPQRAPARRQPTEGEAPLGRCERAILTVLAQHGRRTTTQVALLSGYSAKSGGFRNSLSSLRSAGRIEGRGEVEVTQAGIAALGEYEPLPAGPALVEWWYGQLGRAERTVLEVLVKAWPSEVPTDQIASYTGYSASSGGFRNALSRLRSLELASGRGALVASDVLGEAARMKR
jgi:hypothetical protein